MEILNPFSIDEIYSQVNRILDFTAFKNSPTLSKFFQFVISETVQKRNEQIKEYSIAVNVLNRPTDFNPHDDAVVRIHAGRLRRALNEYYFTAGISDSIIIDIPKGCYIPNFQLAKAAPPKENASFRTTVTDTDNRPVIAIFPLKITPYSSEGHEFGVVLGEQLSAELSRFKDLLVIGYYSDEVIQKIEQNVLEAGRILKTDYILSGNILISKHKTRIRINLLVASTGEVLLTKSFDKESPLLSIVEIQDEIINEVIASLGGYSGLLFKEMAKASPFKASRHAKVREAISKYYKYHRYFSIENYKDAFSTIPGAVKEYPDNAISWAMLGELHMGGLLLGLSHTKDPLRDAQECILTSLRIDPLCQHAWYADTFYHLFRHDNAACLNSANKCIHLNPNNHTIVGGVGFMLVCGGYFEKGYPLMYNTVHVNPFYPWWLNGGICLYHLYKGNYAEAFKWAEKLHCEEICWDPLLKCVSLAHQKKLHEAKIHLEKLLLIEPDISKNIDQLLSMFLLSSELKLQIINGLEKAGL
jgi:TolB-like protein